VGQIAQSESPAGTVVSSSLPVWITIAEPLLSSREWAQASTGDTAPDVAALRVHETSACRQSN
jgi:hypothetical protein